MATLPIRGEDAGISVYGVPQFSYSINGVPGYDFDAVVSKVSINQATIIDEQMQSISRVLRLRQRAAADLGDALALISGVLCKFTNDTPTSDDVYKMDPDSQEAKELQRLKGNLEKYGYDLVTGHQEYKPDKCGHGGQDEKITITRGTAMRAQVRVEELIDMENNNIQQDMNAAQGFLSKRDKSFSHAEKVVGKYEDTAVNIIKAFN